MVTHMMQAIEAEMNDAHASFTSKTVEDYFKRKLNVYLSTTELVEALSFAFDLPAEQRSFPTAYGSTWHIILTQAENNQFNVEVMFNKQKVSLKGQCGGAEACEMSNFFELI